MFQCIRADNTNQKNEQTKKLLSELFYNRHNFPIYMCYNLHLLAAEGEGTFPNPESLIHRKMNQGLLSKKLLSFFEKCTPLCLNR